MFTLVCSSSLDLVLFCLYKSAVRKWKTEKPMGLGRVILQDKFMLVTVRLPWVMVVSNYPRDVIIVPGVELVEGVSLCRERAAMAAVALTVRASEAVEMTIVVILYLRSAPEVGIDLEVVIDAMMTSIVVTAEMVTAEIEDGATIVEFL